MIKINTKINILVFIITSLLSVYWIINFSFIDFLDYRISLGHVAYIFFLLIPFLFLKSNKNINLIWIILSTIIAVDMFPMIFYANNLPKNNNLIFIGLIILLFFVFINILILNKKEVYKSYFKKDKIKWFLFSSLFLISSLQIFNHIMDYQGFADEDRSLFVLGLEIHHINFGLLFFIFLPTIKYFYSKIKKIKIFFTIIVGIFYGLVWDEWFYYLYQNMTGKNYIIPKTYLSSIFFILISLSVWFYIINNFEKNKK